MRRLIAITAAALALLRRGGRGGAAGRPLRGSDRPRHPARPPQPVPGRDDPAGRRPADARRPPHPPAAPGARDPASAAPPSRSRSGGWLVTARHVAAPDDESVALLRLPDQARPRGQGPRRRGRGRLRGGDRRDARGRPRHAPGGAPGGRRRGLGRVAHLRAHRGSCPASAPTSRCCGSPRRAAPALVLNEAASIGTPVASLGFGTGSAFAEPVRGDLEPAVRRGALARTGTLDGDEPEERNAILTDHRAGARRLGRPGDRRRGQRPRRRGHPHRTRAASPSGRRRCASCCEATGIDARARPARRELFREGMAAFWSLDLAAAQRSLGRRRAGLPRPHARGHRGPARPRPGPGRLRAGRRPAAPGLPARPRGAGRVRRARVRHRPGARRGVVGEDPWGPRHERG